MVQELIDEPSCFSLNRDLRSRAHKSFELGGVGLKLVVGRLVTRGSLVENVCKPLSDGRGARW